LYEALATLSKLLAPSMPFLADELYRNLVLSVEPDAPKSVHMADWPDFNADWLNDDLVADMNLVMKLVSLGHAARNKSKIKVRQPLQEAAFAVSNLHDSKVVEEYAELLKDELNVKSVRSLSAASEAAAYELMPLPQTIGPEIQRSISRHPQRDPGAECRKIGRRFAEWRGVENSR
jgi:Isoleucyl-tRNA synthetase